MPAWAAVVLAVGCGAGASVAGPFPGPAGSPGSDAVSAEDPRIVAWATSVAGHDEGGELDFGFGSYPTAALGWSNGLADDGLPDCGATVSLGRGGSVTLTFLQPITDGPGDDFAVFENSFGDNFLELAFVEVSDDGANFVRFPSRSLTEDPVGPFDGGGVDPTDIDGFAGKYRAGYGTPFDLGDVGLRVATHVRLVDVVGGGVGQDTDSEGAPVHDPFPTQISAGFDLDAVAVLHSLLPYERWAEDLIGPELPVEKGADADGDGFDNLSEFAFGSDPADSASRPHLELGRPGPGGELLAIEVPAAPLHGGFTVTIEASADLSQWNEIAIRRSAGLMVPLIEGVTAGDADGETEVVRVARGAGTEFHGFRLVVAEVAEVAALLTGQAGSAPFDPCLLYGSH